MKETEKKVEIDIGGEDPVAGVSEGGGGDEGDSEGAMLGPLGVELEVGEGAEVVGAPTVTTSF